VHVRVRVRVRECVRVGVCVRRAAHEWRMEIEKEREALSLSQSPSAHGASGFCLLGSISDVLTTSLAEERAAHGHTPLVRVVRERAKACVRAQPAAHHCAAAAATTWVVTHSSADSDFHGHRPAVCMNQHPLWGLDLASA
jgi:hypothetical protein